MVKIKKQEILEQINQQISHCSFCNQHKQGQLVPGEGDVNAKLMFIGEAPGKQEILTGEPFIGRAGKVLTELIESLGLARSQVFITSAVKYLPKTYVTPKPQDIEHGRLHLFEQVKIIKPKIITLLGSTAIQSVLDKKLSMTKCHGKFLAHEGQQYFLSYHPAAPLYSPKLREVIKKDFLKLKRKLTA